MENSSNTTGSGKGMGMLGYAALGVGALLIINSMNGGAPSKVELNESDYNFLNNTGPKALQTLIDNDTSPVLYTSPGNTPRTQEQTDLLLAKLKKRYVDDLAVGQLSFPTNMLSDVIMALLDLDDQEVRQQTLDMYVKMFDLYTKLFTATFTATAIGVAAITQAAGVSINDAYECTEWTWAKYSDYSVEQTSTTNTTISTKANTTKVLMGILGSGGSTSTMHNTIKTENLKERQQIEYRPHCTSKQIDLAAVEAILIAQGAALKTIYDPLRAVIALAPVLPKKTQVNPLTKISLTVQ